MEPEQPAWQPTMCPQAHEHDPQRCGADADGNYLSEEEIAALPKPRPWWRRFLTNW